MTKQLIVSSAVASMLTASTIHYGYHANHAALLPARELQVYGSIMAMNDALDLLNFKQQELGSSQLSATAIGDLTGWEGALRYGISERLMASYNYTHQNISYGAGTLHNTRHETSIKYNLIHAPNAFFDSTSIEVGAIWNKGKKMTITQLDQMNDLMQRAFPTLEERFARDPYTGDPVLRKKNGDLISSLTLEPYVAITNLADTSFYLKLLAGFKRESGVVDFYLGAKQTSITSMIDS
ncbi:MAG: hypothetical protein K6347_08380 [Campylobacterales bacterium]